MFGMLFIHLFTFLGRFYLRTFHLNNKFNVAKAEYF